MVDNKIYARFCQLAAANVQNQQGQVRYSQKDLERALSPDDGVTPPGCIDLLHKIMAACSINISEEDKWLDVLLIIHKQYLVLNRQWVDTTPSDTTDELGFEIF